MKMKVISCIYLFSVCVKNVFCAQGKTTGVFATQEKDFKLADIPYETIENTGTWNHCLLLCVQKQICDGFNYHGNSARCELYNTVDCSQLISANGWRTGHLKTEHGILPTSNLALQKPTYQSSTRDVNTNGPEKAVDGNTDGDFSKNSCTHSETGELHPWWIVDLGKSYHLHEIVIWNRDDWGERLHDFSIAVACEFDGMNPNNTNWKMQHLHDGPVDSDPKLISLSHSPITRFIKIENGHIESPNGPGYDILTLCEVEVFGTPDNECTCES